ncbi:DUF2812 domain-containing protein [Facklamia sp. DSM 111018]|uniref:DUF2812 domain-containing protein n=1 Tax=Facklamia lactis TaxID=2749967 RepID=A0ABS0LNR6_9LACT|nr:DUF2812 domain-containing protein [Facklamia lactis]MBG9979713.1 DUF2812 domain-containing protein [Facklamia lactis]MBG9985607.1 DUF2812 domain-containing protein [Facklamia lactis]
MKKCKLFFDPLKEEEWLNTILQQGYQLISKSLLGTYVFEPTDQEYIARVDYQDCFSNNDYEEYLNIFHEYGWQLVDGDKCVQNIHIWQKLKEKDDNLNKLNSDLYSKGQFYKRMKDYSASMALFTVMYYFLFIDQMEIYLFHPEIWEMKGLMFWKAALFELPFGILRLLPVILFVGCIAFYAKNYFKYRDIVESIEKTIKNESKFKDSIKESNHTLKIFKDLPKVKSFNLTFGRSYFFISSFSKIHCFIVHSYIGSFHSSLKFLFQSLGTLYNL